MAARKKAGGVAAPAGSTNICKTTFAANHTAIWRSAQRAHELRASALCARGIELRRLVRARARA